MIKSAIWIVRPSKTQIRLRIRAVWSESSLIACIFYNLQTIKRGMKYNIYPTGWMFRLIWVFAGHAGLIVGFIVRWLKSQLHVHSWDNWHTSNKELQQRNRLGWARRNTLRTAKTLIRLRECAGWSESSLSARMSKYTVELQCLEHLWDHGNSFETWVVRATEG